MYNNNEFQNITSGSSSGDPTLLLQPNPHVYAVNSPNRDIWEIWLHDKSRATNWATPPTNQFILIKSMISTLQELYIVLDGITDESLGQHFEFIFCRQGMSGTTNTGLGNWRNYSFTLPPTLITWKEACESLMMKNMGSQNTYALKIETFSSNQHAISCYWIPY